MKHFMNEDFWLSTDYNEHIYVRVIHLRFYNSFSL